MKIDKPSQTLPTNPTTEMGARASVKDKSGQPPASQQAESTNVSLGSTATQLQSLEASMTNAPAIDAAKVAEIKQAISEGRFQVNSSLVADRLIATVRDLIDNKA